MRVAVGKPDHEPAIFRVQQNPDCTRKRRLFDGTRWVSFHNVFSTSCAPRSRINTRKSPSVTATALPMRISVACDQPVIRDARIPECEVSPAAPDFASATGKPVRGRAAAVRVSRVDEQGILA